LGQRRGDLDKPRATGRWLSRATGLWALTCAACSAAGDGVEQPLVRVVSPAPASITDSESVETDRDGAGPGELDPSRLSEATLSAERTACGAVQAELEPISRPVDVVLVVDNSLGMDDKVQSVQENINRNFAAVLEELDVDYRFILISEHADSRRDDAALCIEAPLSAQTGCFADQPAFSERFFQFSTEVGNDDSLEVLLETFAAPLGREDDFDLAPNGWSEWLRDGASLVFVEITDDDSDLSALDFLSGLEALSPVQFGRPNSPKFVWHSIVGVPEKSDASAPYAPDEPLEESECGDRGGDANNAGKVYQQLSRLTEGLRFPICQHNAYDSVFRAIASEVARAGQLPCEFALPPAPSGTNRTVADARVRLFTGDQAEPSPMLQVDDEGACHADAYLQRNGRLALCESACERVRVDPTARLAVELSCAGERQ
jgi:hypothetical protein